MIFVLPLRNMGAETLSRLAKHCCPHVPKMSKMFGGALRAHLVVKWEERCLLISRRLYKLFPFLGGGFRKEEEGVDGGRCGWVGNVRGGQIGLQHYLH